MFQFRKKLNYKILVPPLSKPIEQLTREEAEAFFAWYMSKIEDRITYLQEYSGLNLDYSSDSLYALWKWFLKIAVVERTPSKLLCDQLQKMEHFLANTSNAYIAKTKNRLSKQLSVESQYIIRDIGMYLGQVFVKNHPTTSWACYMRRDVCCNKPVVLGFVSRDGVKPSYPPFEPIWMVQIQAYKIINGGASADGLLKLYNNWLKYIED